MTEKSKVGAGSAEFVHFKLCGSGFANRRKAADFLRNETLRYPLLGSIWGTCGTRFTHGIQRVAQTSGL